MQISTEIVPLYPSFTFYDDLHFFPLPITLPPSPCFPCSPDQLSITPIRVNLDTGEFKWKMISGRVERRGGRRVKVVRNFVSVANDRRSKVD